MLCSFEKRLSEFKFYENDTHDLEARYSTSTSGVLPTVLYRIRYKSPAQFSNFVDLAYLILHLFGVLFQHVQGRPKPSDVEETTRGPSNR